MRKGLGEEVCFFLGRGNMIEIMGELGLSGDGSRPNHVTGRQDSDRVLVRQLE